MTMEFRQCRAFLVLDMATGECCIWKGMDRIVCYYCDFAGKVADIISVKLGSYDFLATHGLFYDHGAGISITATDPMSAALKRKSSNNKQQRIDDDLALWTQGSVTEAVLPIRSRAPPACKSTLTSATTATVARTRKRKLDVVIPQQKHQKPPVVVDAVSQVTTMSQRLQSLPASNQLHEKTQTPLAAPAIHITAASVPLQSISPVQPDPLAPLLLQHLMSVVTTNSSQQHQINMAFIAANDGKATAAHNTAQHDMEAKHQAAMLQAQKESAASTAAAQERTIQMLLGLMNNK